MLQPNREVTRRRTSALERARPPKKTKMDVVSPEPEKRRDFARIWPDPMVGLGHETRGLQPEGVLGLFV